MKTVISVDPYNPEWPATFAKEIKQNMASIYRNISELEKFRLVKTHEEINPGHGRHKIIELMASKLKLEAYI